MKEKDPKSGKNKKKYKKPSYVKHGVLGRLVVAVSTSSPPSPPPF